MSCGFPGFVPIRKIELVDSEDLVLGIQIEARPVRAGRSPDAENSGLSGVYWRAQVRGYFLIDSSGTRVPYGVVLAIWVKYL